MDSRKFVALIAVVVASAHGLVSAYHVGPTRAAWSGWSPGEDGYVSQLVTVNFDSLVSGGVQLFAGDTCHGSDYNLSIRTYPGAFVIATGAGAAVRPDRWVTFDDIQVTNPESVVKGRLLEFRFSRGGSDSIEYYYDSTDAYQYGYMKVVRN